MRPAPLALLIALAVTGPARADTVEIKVATLAPSGSAWAKMMQTSAARLETETEGRVRLRYYFNAAQGDERDMVRRIKLAQLDGAALSAVGLGLLDPQVLVLELPYLFSTDAQVDHVRAVLGPEFARGLEAAGVTLVSWGDVGWVHTYLTVELKSPDDLARLRFWQWTDDPISRELLAVLGLNGVPLGLPDVLAALQTGTIQACAAPPLAAIALQWYSHVRFMTDRPPSYAIGALVIRTDVLARLTPADRDLLLRGGRELGAKLTASVRRDNERAKKAMLQAGIVVVHIPDDVQAKLVAAGKQVWTRLAGKLYSKELLERVEAVVAEVRGP
jgi:TRAP-type C4-dicarboxylate transport system substrate-binding protein